MLPRLSAPVSGVDCPCPFFHANSLLSSRPAVQSPTASLLGRVVNSHSRPLTTSGYGEISGPRILCLVSGQNRQRNHLLWQPTHIVLQWYLMPPCLTLSIIRYRSRVKWSNTGKGVVPSPTPWCSCYRKGNLRVSPSTMVANFTTFTITEKSIDEALKLAKEYIVISVDKINIIKHCHKSILYHNEKLWIKKGVSGNFENLMSSFDRAKLSEIIECLLLYNI